MVKHELQARSQEISDLIAGRLAEHALAALELQRRMLTEKVVATRRTLEEAGTA